MDFKIKKLKAKFGGIIIVALLIWLSYYIYPFSYLWLSKEGKALNNNLLAIAQQQENAAPVKASKLFPLDNYQEICFMHPYDRALSSRSYDDFFNDKFSGIDVSAVRKQIVREYGKGKDNIIRIYPVESKKITKSFPVYQILLGFDLDMKIKCYNTEDLCLSKWDQKHGIRFGLCAEI